MAKGLQDLVAHNFSTNQVHVFKAKKTEEQEQLTQKYVKYFLRILGSRI